MKRLPILLVSLILFSSPVAAERVVFESISMALSANDMSSDGRFIVGESDLDGDGVADGSYLLDRTTQVMTPLPAPGLDALAVSDDGLVVVGNIPDPEGLGSNVAGRWTADGGWQSLGHLPNAGACPSRSDAYELSADGSTVVGLSWDGCSARGFVWTQSTGMLELQNLANGNNRASVVSADGSVIGGFAQGTFDRTPAVWGIDTHGVLLDPPNGDAQGEIHGIRDDGTVLLGEFTDSAVPPRASKWTATPSGWQREQIGQGSALPGWSGIPLDIADNGTVVGFDFLIGNRRGWIQPQGTGDLMNIRTYFASHGATIPQGMLLEVPQAISSDGHYIIGHGFGSGAWLATILSDCDFDGDVACDINDLDALVMAIATGSNDAQFDLTGDGNVDLADRDSWLAQAGAENLSSGNPYLIGDANLDGFVDGGDFIQWNASKFSATAKWSMGDFDADGVTDGSDFILWNMNKFMSSDHVAAVPEPTFSFFLFCSTIVICLRQRRQR